MHDVMLVFLIPAVTIPCCYSTAEVCDSSDDPLEFEEHTLNDPAHGFIRRQCRTVLCPAGTEPAICEVDGEAATCHECKGDTFQELACFSHRMLPCEQKRNCIAVGLAKSVEPEPVSKTMNRRCVCRYSDGFVSADGQPNQNPERCKKLCNGPVLLRENGPPVCASSVTTPSQLSTSQRSTDNGGDISVPSFSSPPSSQSFLYFSKSTMISSLSELSREKPDGSGGLTWILIIVLVVIVVILLFTVVYICWKHYDRSPIPIVISAINLKKVFFGNNCTIQNGNGNISNSLGLPLQDNNASMPGEDPEEISILLEDTRTNCEE